MLQIDIEETLHFILKWKRTPHSRIAHCEFESEIVNCPHITSMLIDLTANDICLFRQLNVIWKHPPTLILQELQ